jgi:hypothetical protein
MTLICLIRDSHFGYYEEGMSNFGVVMLYTSECAQCFRGTYRLHPQDEGSLGHARNQQK